MKNCASRVPARCGWEYSAGFGSAEGRPPRGGSGLLEGGMDAPVPVRDLKQSLHVGGAQFYILPGNPGMSSTMGW